MPSRKKKSQSPPKSQSKPKICGLDTASSRWHLVSDDGDLLSSSLTGVKWKNPDSRRWRLCVDFEEALTKLGPIVIYAEEPLSLQNGKTTRLLTLAAGALWATATRLGIEWYWVDVAHWKKEVVGKGSATKEMIAEWAVANGAGEEWEQDFYDAYAIMTLGVRKNESATTPDDN